MAPLPQEPSGETGDPDDPDDALVSVRKLWSETEAKQAKAILEANFIASCLGPENIVDLEDFKTSFDSGVDLKVFSRDSRRATSVLSLYAPEEEEPVEDLEEEGNKYAIVCPKCRSEEIVLEGEDPTGKNPTPTETQYSWTCDSCGHQWKDDGIAQIV
jgi:DNA-directed RNA polymerase subunit M/transcription elongation factor TFIIS